MMPCSASPGGSLRVRNLREGGPASGLSSQNFPARPVPVFPLSSDCHRSANMTSGAIRDSLVSSAHPMLPSPPFAEEARKTWSYKISA